MCDIASLHRQEHGVAPDIVVTAPGVVPCLGLHTEATGGLGFLLGIDERASVAVSRRTDGSMRLYAADLGERKRTSSSALRFRPDTRYAGVAKGVLLRLRMLGADVGGLDATISSSIPPDVGLGSSQAIAVAFTRACADLFEHRVTAIETASIAHYSERSFLNVYSCLSGFLGSTLVSDRSGLLLDMREVDWESVPLGPFADRFSLILTEAPSALTGQDKTTRDTLCEECLLLLTGKGTGCSFQEITSDDLTEALGTVPEQSRRWCRYLIEENQRVHRFVCAVEEDDPKLAGAILTQAHEGLSDLYEASSPELDWLVKHVHEVAGVHGARSIGGSKHTAVIVLHDAVSTGELDTRLAEYEHIFGFRASLMPVRTDGGLRVEPGRGCEDPAYKR